MRALICALALCVVCCSAGAVEEASDYEYRVSMSDGMAKMRAGTRQDLVGAVNHFKNAIKLRPENAEPYFWCGLAYSDMQYYQRAASYAKDATVYDERMVNAWLLWGQSLIYLQDWQEAQTKLETGARLDPDNHQIQFNLGRVHYHGNKSPDAALPCFRAVWQAGATLRRENPDLAPMVIASRLYMGYCEFDRQRWDNAINCFRDVLSEQPGNYEAAMRLALAYRRSGRSAESERILWNMLKAIPAENPANRRYLAEINLQLADLYIKDLVLKNTMLATTHLREFINQIGDVPHPAVEPAREFLLAHERD